MAYRVFNTWMGDPGKLILLETILSVIERQNLLDTVNKSGKVLMNGLMDFQREYPELLHSARGRGTFLAISATNTKLRDNILGKLKQKGTKTDKKSLITIVFHHLLFVNYKIPLKLN